MCTVSLTKNMFIVCRGVKTPPPISKTTPPFWVTPPFLKIPEPPSTVPPIHSHLVKESPASPQISSI